MQLGWAADYTPQGRAGSRDVLPRPRTNEFSAPFGALEAASYDGHGRTLLHLPPDIRDFTGRAEQAELVTRLIGAAVASGQTALPVICLSGQAGVGKTTLAIHVAGPPAAAG